jgi:adenylate cyclase, class 2
MSTNRSNCEVEIKLRIGSAAAARALLRRAGFQVSVRRRFEANAVFDTPERGLRGASQLLRVRQCGRAVILTYKGPPAPGKHKSREELEVQLDSATTLHAILSRLGYEISFLYEKFRAEFRQAEGAGVVTVDETPIGNFLELEGPPRWIDRTAALLGFSEADYLTASYASLYLAWCAKNKVSPSHMVFPVGKGSTKVRDTLI